MQRPDFDTLHRDVMDDTQYLIAMVARLAQRPATAMSPDESDDLRMAIAGLICSAESRGMAYAHLQTEVRAAMSPAEEVNV